MLSLPPFTVPPLALPFAHSQDIYLTQAHANTTPNPLRVHPDGAHIASVGALGNNHHSNCHTAVTCYTTRYYIHILYNFKSTRFQFADTAPVCKEVQVNTPSRVVQFYVYIFIIAV